MEIEELIAVLKDADPAQLAMIAREMQKEHTSTKYKRSNVKSEPVKTYTTVIKETTCLCCGSKNVNRYNLVKGEQISSLDKTGVYHIITSTGKEGEVLVPGTTSKCQYCESKVKSWSREELEERFLRLLNSCSFKEVSDYSSPDIYNAGREEPAKIYTSEGKI